MKRGQQKGIKLMLNRTTAKVPGSWFVSALQSVAIEVINCRLTLRDNARKTQSFLELFQETSNRLGLTFSNEKKQGNVGPR